MRSKAFTLIELIVAIGLSALFLPAIIFVYSFSLGSASQGEKYTQAYALAQEQMEAIYYLKEYGDDWSWEDDSINTSSTEFYQLQKDGEGWILGAKISEDTLPAEAVGYTGYTAIVEISGVKRNEDGLIAEDGTDTDHSTKEVKVTVSWLENGVPTDIDLTSYVSKH